MCKLYCGDDVENVIVFYIGIIIDSFCFYGIELMEICLLELCLCLFIFVVFEI